MMMKRGDPMYWLIPIVQLDPLIWSSERIVVPDEHVHLLMATARKIHPRYLMMVKMNALFADEEDAEQCGVGSGRSSEVISKALRDPVRIEWTGNQSFQLSSCGQAFFDALMSVEEARSLWDRQTQFVDSVCEPFFRLVHLWLTTNQPFFLLKED
jgi:hypothetical protein